MISVKGKGIFPQEKNLKKIKKTLDKQNSICYNKDTNKEEVVAESQGGSKNFKKNKKKVLTNKSRNAIIKM